MKIPEMISTLREIRYKDWRFEIVVDCAIYLRVSFDSHGTQHGRKWILTEHMTKSEFVQTVFKAVITAEEHETREAFTYRGGAVYGPHIDVESLLRTAHALDIREPSEAQ